MDLKQHSTGIGVAVAALALAGSGTVMLRGAHVDSAGRLATTSTPTTSDLAYTNVFTNGGSSILTSPTTAKIAITNLTVSETRVNGAASGSDLALSLVQVKVTGQLCTSAVIRTIAQGSISSGQTVQLASPTPYLVKPAGSAKYCLLLESDIVGGGSDQTSFNPTYTFNGYAIGTYTGRGLRNDGRTTSLQKK